MTGAQVYVLDPLADLDWRDTGCAAGGPSCLACPLARCVEEIGGAAKFQRDQRDREVRAALHSGSAIEAVAAAYNLSVHQAQRIGRGARS